MNVRPIDWKLLLLVLVWAVMMLLVGCSGGGGGGGSDNPPADDPVVSYDATGDWMFENNGDFFSECSFPVEMCEFMDKSFTEQLQERPSVVHTIVQNGTSVQMWNYVRVFDTGTVEDNYYSFQKEELYTFHTSQGDIICEILITVEFVLTDANHGTGNSHIVLYYQDIAGAYEGVTSFTLSRVGSDPTPDPTPDPGKGNVWLPIRAERDFDNDGWKKP